MPLVGGVLNFNAGSVPRGRPVVSDPAPPDVPRPEAVAPVAASHPVLPPATAPKPAPKPDAATPKRRGRPRKTG